MRDGRLMQALYRPEPHCLRDALSYTCETSAPSAYMLHRYSALLFIPFGTGYDKNQILLYIFVLHNGIEDDNHFQLKHAMGEMFGIRF